MAATPTPPPPPARATKAATRSVNRAEIIDRNFLALLADIEATPEQMLPSVTRADFETAGLASDDALQILEAQLMSRHLDYAARRMRSRNEGFYTIGSAGHEANAVLGWLTRVTDPAFLHYRSGAFVMARGMKVPGLDPVLDTAHGIAASAEDPISGGRHKVWGSRPLWIPPQTSTIASQLPKAVGAAVALAQAARVEGALPVPDDSIVYCSFGDASTNHATALSAFNSAAWTAYQRLPVPILFVCEDNGLGISVRTPGGWVKQNFAHRQDLRYLHADGTDLLDTVRVARAAIDWCRRERRPVFLHITHPRLLAHAGTDAEAEYRPVAEIEADEARDPLLNSARSIVAARLLSVMELRQRYEAIRERTEIAARRAAKAPKLRTAQEVMRPLTRVSPADRVLEEATRAVPVEDRERAFAKGGLPELAAPRHLAIQINRALTDLMVKYPQMTLFGEDVAQKGGVYTVTTGLANTFGGRRVFNTLLDETTVLGIAQGAAHMGLLPFPEIQYLAYFHNAGDQIRGEACSLKFFSNGQFTNPMVMRIASLGYQRGFGGHFHNDNSITALRDIPGLIIACPSRGDDAAELLRTCAALAQLDGRVVAFLEPIALYMTKDLHEERDGKWVFPYPEPDKAAPFGAPRVYEEAEGSSRDPVLLIVTYGNGVRMSLRVARQLEQEHGARARVLDLRWLKPLNAPVIANHARDAGRVLVVDEGRRTGGISEEIFTLLDEHAPSVHKRRVTGEDSYIPLGDAANLVLVSEGQIRDAAQRLLR
ncbi:MAG: thiamine pyrophosphate-dependent enzyme [Pseudomonadota bacterium]